MKKFGAILGGFGLLLASSQANAWQKQIQNTSGKASDCGFVCAAYASNHGICSTSVLGTTGTNSACNCNFGEMPTVGGTAAANIGVTPKTLPVSGASSAIRAPAKIGN